MRRHQLLAVLLAFALFVSGAVVGALGDRFYGNAVVKAKSAEDFRHHYVEEMQSRLKLTPGQVDQLQAILDETKAKYKKVREAYRPQLLELKREQIARVKTILKPEQVPLYEQLVAEREKRAREQDERDTRAERARESRAAAGANQ